MLPTVPEFLRPLERACHPFPREAVLEAVARKDEAIPHLLAALECAIQDPEEVIGGPEDESPSYILQVYALFLLAQFRETRALPLIIRLFRLPSHEFLAWDVVTGALDAVLASVCGGEIAPLQALASDRQVDPHVRSAAVAALGTLVKCGLRTREEVSPWLGQEMARAATRAESPFLDSLLMVSAELNLREHLPAMRRIEARGWSELGPLVDELEEAMGSPEFEAAETPWCSPHLVEDACGYLEQLDYFLSDEEWARRLDEEEMESGEAADEARPWLGAPVVRDAPKVGRNDPCPCGSGKKFKRCCG